MIKIEADSPLLIPIQIPAILQTVGCSQSGKSRFIFKLLINHEKMLSKPVGKFIYCYSVWTPEFNELQRILGDKIQFRKDLPDEREICDYWETYNEECVCICDDKMHLFDDSKEAKLLLRIATTLSHHAHFSLFLTMQNLFYGSKISRTLSLNSHYFCIFRHNRSHDQVRRFAQQVMSNDFAFFMDSYNMATKEKYSYLFVDLSPHSDQKYKLKYAIFPDEIQSVFLQRTK